MTGAEKRRALAAIGCDLAARDGGPAERRAAGLLRRLGGADEPRIDFADLETAPGWLRLPRAARQRIAQRTALFAFAPALARSIDGAWLGAYAAVAGEEAVDWAIERADRAPAGIDPVAAPDLTAQGFAMLRATLPERLRSLLDATPSATCGPEVASACLIAVLEDAR